MEKSSRTYDPRHLLLPPLASQDWLARATRPTSSWTQPPSYTSWLSRARRPQRTTRTSLLRDEALNATIRWEQGALGVPGRQPFLDSDLLPLRGFRDFCSYVKCEQVEPEFPDEEETQVERRAEASLTYLKDEIARCERRIKRIRENPDPSKPKSNILLYEMERDLRIEQMEAYKSGKPIGWAGFGPLTRAMGMVPWDAIMAADRTHGKEATRYFDIIRREGMPEHTCDRCSILIPMTLCGDFPRPNFVNTSNFECMPGYLAHVLIAQLMDIPTFNIDRHFKNYKGELDDEHLQYVTDQITEMIQYIEDKVPGTRYNEEKLIELQEYDRQFLKWHRELWRLKAIIPCPLNAKEAFREVRLADMYPYPQKAVEYMRLYVEEIGERAAKGWGAAHPEEKIRLLWSVSGPFYADPFSWLEKRGVAVPAAEMSVLNGWFSGREAIWGDPWKGRKLTPLEEEARQLDYVWGRLGEPWIRTNIDSCRELHLDGIIYFLQWGCPTTNNLGKLVSEVAEKELGIPTLLIEGRMLESGIYDEKDFFSKLEDFIEVCLERKHNREREVR